MLNNKNQGAGSKLKTTMDLNIHTQYAINLIEGTKNDRAFIPGLISFSSKLKIVKLDHDKGNPFAKHYMNIVDEKFKAAAQSISNEIKDTEEITSKIESDNFSLPLSSNPNPTKKSFFFAVPFCYKVAIQIHQYDMLIRKLNALEVLGYISKNTINEKINNISKELRKLFHSIEKYTSFEVSEQDKDNKSEQYIQAEKIMGQIQ